MEKGHQGVGKAFCPEGASGHKGSSKSLISTGRNQNRQFAGLAITGLLVTDHPLEGIDLAGSYSLESRLVSEPAAIRAPDCGLFVIFTIIYNNFHIDHNSFPLSTELAFFSRRKGHQ